MTSPPLSRPALVLNRNWQPVHVTTVARALSHVYTGVARVVDVEGFQMYSWDEWVARPIENSAEAIRGVTIQVAAPEVIVLAAYDQLPRVTVNFSRRNLLRRDRHQCQYCGRSPQVEQLTVDHILPKSKGGESTWENCVLACQPCNHRKANRTPKEAGMSLRTRPERPRWRPDFSVSDARRQRWRPFLVGA